MSEFKHNVLRAVQSVPFGKVASYGQIAAMVGSPRAARQVGWILNSTDNSNKTSENNLPWWRIVNNSGRISIKGAKHVDATTQKFLLENEGLEINENFSFDIEKYRYRPTHEEMQKFD